jgi:adenosylhomocysteine nucleosidase
MTSLKNHTCVVLISANAEWEAALRKNPDSRLESTPFGEFFTGNHPDWDLIFCQGGWGKIAAAASTQFAISTWKPDLIVNLGTCGGFAGRVEQGEIILAAKTAVYDIVERMGDMQAALDFFTVKADLSWLCEPFPHDVRHEVLVSADQDLDPAMVSLLEKQFGASAADWESGAIAWTVARNQTRCLILRGVSDLVSEDGGEAYEEAGLFDRRAAEIMDRLLAALPAWLDCVR